MKDKILAIKGHPTRRNEVIEILEMLGGNKGILGGGDTNFIYYIKPSCNYIQVECINNCNLNEFVIFTLEQFLKNFPYKVGDKVKTIRGKIGNISECIWSVDNCVKYKLETDDFIDSYYRSQELIPYKEEIKTEDRLEIYADHAIDNDSKTDIIINGERLIAPNGYTIGNATRNSNKLIVEYIKNKPQYPKTFQECYSLKYNGQINLNIGCDILHGAYSEQLECLQNLLICRDIYWEIAGDWEEKRKKEINHYVIYSTLNGGLVKDCLSCTMVKHLLDFPTEEMRDAFYENFKDLIEKCKEFL